MGYPLFLVDVKDTHSFHLSFSISQLSFPISPALKPTTNGKWKMTNDKFTSPPVRCRYEIGDQRKFREIHETPEIDEMNERRFPIIAV